MAPQPKHIYEFGPFRLIPSERQLLQDDARVPLTGKSFDLLVVLVENSGRLVEKKELLQQIWPDSFVEEANLSVNLSTVRHALGEGPDDRRYVETVPRHGYRFVAEVKDWWENGVTDVAPDDGDRTAATSEIPAALSIPAATPQSHRSFPGWLWVLAGLVLVTGALVALNPGGFRNRLFGRTPVRIGSLAVLPLQNASGDTSQEYFADGMTEMLITSLTKMRELRVMSRPTVMKYKNAGKSPTEIGRELELDAVITGSVIRKGDSVRVALQLIEVPTGRSLWTYQYDRDLRDVLALQADVIHDLAEKIGARSPSPQRETSAASVNAEAYDQYLRGQFYLNRQTREGNEAAIAALELAVAKDPNFAAAQAELAQAYVWKLFLFAPREKQLEEKAFVAVEKALALDPDSAVAYLARGRLLWTPANHFPHDRAIKEYRYALALNPALDEAHNQLALIYSHIGAFPEALQESQLALTADPNNQLAEYRIGETLNWQGKHEEALAVLRALPRETNPELVGYQIAWALFNLGKKDEASAVLEQLLKDYPEDNRGLFGSVQAILAASAGQERLAENKIKSAVERGKGFGHFHHTAYHIACAYALMKKSEQAVKWLEVAADDGFACFPLFARDPNLDNLRHDPRFVAFLSKSKEKWEYYKTILQR
jgi:TolB-like protein/DNA-binding winged helix-turn-helix (wHTH) protein/lipopolysaccharide biosynthesis regulator YciM